MGTLEGFPNPPAMVRGRQSRPAPHAFTQTAPSLKTDSTTEATEGTEDLTVPESDPNPFLPVRLCGLGGLCGEIRIRCHEIFASCEGIAS